MVKNKILALDSNGNLSWCISRPENRGKGKCPHLLHQEEGENYDSFMQRCNLYLESHDANLQNHAKNNPAIMKDHNQSAYQLAKKLFDEGVAGLCIVQATATGKSSVMTALLDDYAEQQCVFVSPRSGINEQFMEHNAMNWVGLLGNLVTLTYHDIQSAYRSNRFEQKFGNLRGKVKLLCLDEIHHLSQNKWDEAMKEFVRWVEKDDIDDQTLICGATATSITDPVTGYDPIDYYGEGHSVSNIGLTDAINKDILKMPKIYSVPGKKYLDKQLQSLLDEINGIPDDLQRNTLLAQLSRNEKLKNAVMSVSHSQNEALHMALDEKIKRDSSNGHGTKILVFCENKNHCDENVQKYQKLLEEQFPSLKVHCGKYVEGSSSEERSGFDHFRTESADRNSLEVLMVVDKYNEGIHAVGVDVEIMERSVSDSDSLYKQQVGRVMSGNDPIIIDFAGNTHNGYIDWEQVAKQTSNQKNLHIEAQKTVSEEIKSQKMLIAKTKNPSLFATDRNGEIVKVSEWMKEHGYWVKQRSIVNQVAQYANDHKVNVEVAVLSINGVNKRQMKKSLPRSELKG